MIETSTDDTAMRFIPMKISNLD